MQKFNSYMSYAAATSHI